jgi:hypothetical protein
LRAKSKRDPRLLRIFRDYNGAFFGGAIEEPEIMKYKKMRDKAGLSVMSSQGPTAIYIHSGLRPFYRMTQIVVLHEMCHVELGMEYRPHHGTRWQARIDQMYKMGAYEELL